MNLREFRCLHKGQQRQYVANQIGICGKHLNDIEAGRVNLTDKLAVKLSELYGIGVDEVKSMYEEGKDGKYRGSRKAGSNS